MNGKWKRYPAYRESGVEWLRQVPEHWQVRRLKFLASEPLAYGANEAAESTEPSNPRFIRITDIRGDGTLHDDTFRSLPEHLAKPYLLEHGDLLLARSGATVGKTFMYRRSWGRACHAGYLIRCRLKPTVARPEFVSYFTNSAEYWAWLSSVFSQATIQNVSAEKYANLPIPVPEPEDQAAILTFLDRETAKIDALVAKKERLIELLQEKRTALISHAVTRGLNPNAPLRDSGIPWIGRIPEGWQLIELRRLVVSLRPITYGIVQPGALDPSGVPMVRGQDYSGGWVPTDRMFHVSPEVELPYRRSRLEPDDILMTIVGAGVGNLAIVPEWLRRANITQTTARIAINQRLGWTSFIAYALRSNVGQAWVRTSTKGAAQPGLTLANVSRFRIPVPPLDAQQAIAEFLDRETARIDTLVTKVKSAIDRLQEYRTALISAAVTGQIDVREEARPIWTGSTGFTGWGGEEEPAGFSSGSSCKSCQKDPDR